MNKRMKRVVALLLMGTITLAGSGVLAQAATGIQLAGMDYVFGQAFSSGADIEANVKRFVKSEFDSIAIAQVNTYVNVRAEASLDSEIIGKIYNDCAGDIIEELDGWYKIKSGSVTGYVKSDYFVTGKEAEELAMEIAERIAVVDTTTLNVRKEPNTDCDILALVGDGERLTILEETEDWAKISLDNVVGYVSKEYVQCETIFDTAESLEEEAARIAAEQEAVRIALEEARKADEAAQQAIQPETQAPVAETPVTEAPETEVPETQAPETQAPETEAPAVEEPQTEAPVGEEPQTEAPTVEEPEAPETQAPETQAPQTEAPVVEEPQTEAPQTEAPVVEEPKPETPSNTGTREGLVSFALQFNGNPYAWGGTSLTNGADCSGFVQSLYSQYLGIYIPRVAQDQAYGGGRAVSLDSIQPGDLLFYGSGGAIDHVAMYIGGGQIIHASNPQSGIKISSYNYRQPSRAVNYID